jgi:TonB family protein
MKSNNTLLGAALFGSVLSVSAFAAPELIELIPVQQTAGPVLAKMVRPPSVPARYEDSTIRISFTVDTTGQPQDIRVLDLNDPVLMRTLLPALAQWRFEPARKDGVAVKVKVVLPLKLVCDNTPTSQLPLQIGALKVAVAHDARIVATQEENTHPAMYHVNAIECKGQNVLRDNAADSTVRECLGEPEKLAENVWAYSGYSGMAENVDRHGCTTILLSFQDHHVATIALVNDRAKNLVAMQLRTNPAYVDQTLLGMHKSTVFVQN